jgi:hypothetical protein
MAVHRLYIDSRDRVSGDASDFSYQLSMDVTVVQESIAVLDTVIIPVSWYVVEEDINDRIYITEENFSGTGHRIATISPGHYGDAFAMAAGIEEALNAGGRMVISPYTVTFNRDLGRFQIGNPWTGPNEACYIASEWTLQNSLDPEIFWGVSRGNLRGAFRQIGMVLGYSVGAGRNFGDTPFTLRDLPNLQNHTELFIQGSLGIPGLIQGPGNHVQETLRRVVVSAPPFGLNFDQSVGYYDNIRIAPGTISTLKFKLVGVDGRMVDLQGSNWSFSLLLFPRGTDFPLLS